MNIGIIGAGNAGITHAKTLLKQKNTRISAIADIDKKRLDALGRELDVPHRYTEWNDLLQQPDIDAFIIATPPALRVDIFEEAVATGKPILCEKPFGINIVQARKMAASAKAGKSRVMVNFGTRSLPSYCLFRDLLKSGKYGSPQWMWMSYFLPSSKKIFIPPDWFWRQETSGGHLLENGGHALDLIRVVMGEISSVSAQMARPDIFERSATSPTMDIESVAAVTLRHEGGGMTVLSNGCSSSGGWGMSIDVWTESSLISMRDNRIITIQQEGKVIYRRTGRVGWDPIVFGARRFVGFLKGNSEGLAGPGDGLRAIEIADAAYRSDAEGKVITL